MPPRRLNQAVERRSRAHREGAAAGGSSPGSRSSVRTTRSSATNPAAGVTCSKLSNTSSRSRSRSPSNRRSTVVPRPHVDDADRPGDGGGNEVRIAHRREVHEMHAVDEAWSGVQFPRNLDGQSRLADPAGSEQRHQPNIRVPQQVRHPDELGASTEDRRRRSRDDRRPPFSQVTPPRRSTIQGTRLHRSRNEMAHRHRSEPVTGKWSPLRSHLGDRTQTLSHFYALGRVSGSSAGGTTSPVRTGNHRPYEGDGATHEP